MKILLDESLPRKLKNDFGNAHEVFTVSDKNWLKKKNGTLLKLMVESESSIPTKLRPPTVDHICTLRN